MGAEQAARRIWTFAEPIHAVTYYAAESRQAYEEIGLRGFWRGYFAGRAAPLGPVGPGVVTACFYGFHPSFVARAVPEVWSLADPAVALDARLTGVDRGLRRLIGPDLDPPAMTAAANLIRDAVEACSVSGRPLFAANRELAWPHEAHLALWHATTLLREHRGDGHVVALSSVGLDGCEAHVTQVIANGAPAESIQPYRGWSDDDWAAAVDRLRDRGWLDGEGRLTSPGRARREQVEDLTDKLAAEPIEHLGMERTARLVELLAPFTSSLVDRMIPYPNAIGVPRPDLQESG
jgi:hypothetical protein